jgi:acetyl esterase/lipase
MRSLLLFGLFALAACSGTAAGSPGSTAPPPVDAGAADTAPPPDDAPITTAAVTLHILDVTAGGVEITKALWGDVIDVRVTGLAAMGVVTVHARSKGYESYATFSAGADGTVDVATSAPSAGTYQGVDPDGLIWSMQPKPDPSDTSADPLALYFRAEVDGVVAATAMLPRSALGPGVTRVDVNANGLVGAFFAPAASGAHGAVIAFGGSEGGLSTGRYLAAYFASLGHPALGLAYFGAPGVPAQLSQIPLEYFQHARDWLAARPEVAPTHIAVVGGSRGGELALLLGATFPWITAVVAEVPSGVLWGAPTANGLGETSSWTLGGQPLPYIPYSGSQPQTVTLSDGSTASALTPAFDQDLHAASAAQLDAATTRVEKTVGPILMTAGADDQLWPSCELAQIAMGRLTQSGHASAHGDQLVCYPGAGHNVAFAIGFPALGELKYPDPNGAGLLAIGGDPMDIGHAQRDADTKVRAFLAANLK